MNRIIYILCFIFACSITYAKNSDKAEKLFEREKEYFDSYDYNNAFKCVIKQWATIMIELKNINLGCNFGERKLVLITYMLFIGGEKQQSEGMPRLRVI
jgi:hypothetical protein